MNNAILTYNTPNSGEIFQNIHQYEFNRIWKQNLKKNNKNIYWGITSLALAALTFFYEDYAFTGFFSGFSLAAFSYFFSYYSIYKKIRKNFLKSLREKFQISKQIPMM